MKTFSFRSGISLPLLAMAGCLATAMGQTVTVKSADNSTTYSSTNPITISVPVGGYATPVNLLIDTNPSNQDLTVGLNLPALGAQYVYLSPTSGKSPMFVGIGSLQSAPAFPQTYTGTLTVSIGTTQAASVPVNLVIGSGSGGGGIGGGLVLMPNTLEFDVDNNALPPAKGVAVAGAYSGADIFAVTTCDTCTTGNTWLITSVVGKVGDPYTQVLVSVSTAGLPSTAKTYNGVVHISAAGQTADLPVVLKINGGGSGTGGNGGTGGGLTGATVTPTSLTFNYNPNATSNVTSQTFTVTTTQSIFAYNITIPDAAKSWLSVSPIGANIGTTSGFQPSATHTVTINAGGLAANTYQTDIQVIPLGQTSGQNVHVTLTVGSGGGNNGGTLQTDATALLFNMAAAQTSASQQLLVTTTGSNFNYSVNASTPTCTSGGSIPGITVPTTGTTGTPITITVTPPSLTTGRLDCSATLTLSGAANTLSIPITIAQTTTPVLNICTNTSPAVCPPQRIRLSAAPGQTATTQVVITSSGDPVQFSAQANGNTVGSGTWLTLGANQPTNTITLLNTPYTLQINAQQSAPGTYEGSVTIFANTPSGALPNGSWNIPVTLTVATGGGTGANVTANPNPVTLNANTGSTTAVTQQVTLTADNNAALAYSTSISYNTSGESWLTVSPTTGATGVNNLVLTANPTGLNGTHQATITVNITGGNTVTIPVTFNLAQVVNVTASPSSVAMNAIFGSTTGLLQQFTLTAANNASLPYTASVSYDKPGESWLSIVQGATGNTGQTNGLAVSAQPAALSAGEHKATINVNVTGGSPVSIPVSLVIAPQLALNTQSLSFTGVSGSAQNPANQTFTITSAAGTVNYSVAVNATSCGGAWLTAAPTSGTTAAGTPAVITVSASGLSGMQAGTCAGTITVSAAGLPSQTVNVTLNVANPPAPQILKIVSAGSFLPGPIAPGEIIAVGGSYLGPATQQLFQLENGMVPGTLAGTRVLFDGIPGAVLSISPVPGNDPTLNQVNVIVPYEIAGRAQVSIQVERNNVRSMAVIQQVVPTAPALFLANATDVAMYNNTKGNYNSPTTPASIGDIMTVYGTGEGMVVPLPATGSVTGTTLATIGKISAPYSVRLGGVALSPNDVLYVGPAPGQVAGVFQVNFRVPSYIKDTRVPVSVAIGAGGDQAPQGTGYMYVQP